MALHHIDSGRDESVYPFRAAGRIVLPDIALKPAADPADSRGMIDQLVFAVAVSLLRSTKRFVKGRNLVIRTVVAAARKGWTARHWRQIGGFWYWIDLGDADCRALVLNGVVHPEIRDHVMEWLPETGVFVDVGADFGYLTMTAARRTGRRGKVVAVESKPPAVAVLRENLSRNRVLNVAVVPELSREMLDRRDVKRVDVVRLASRGSELQILRILEDMVARFHPAIIVESTPASVVFYLEGLGYTSQWIGDHSTVFRCHRRPSVQAAPEQQGALAVPA